MNPPTNSIPPTQSSQQEQPMSSQPRPQFRPVNQTIRPIQGQPSNAMQSPSPMLQQRPLVDTMQPQRSLINPMQQNTISPMPQNAMRPRPQNMMNTMQQNTTRPMQQRPQFIGGPNATRQPNVIPLSNGQQQVRQGGQINAQSQVINDKPLIQQHQIQPQLQQQPSQQLQQHPQSQIQPPVYQQQQYNTGQTNSMPPLVPQFGKQQTFSNQSSPQFTNQPQHQPLVPQFNQPRQQQQQMHSQQSQQQTQYQQQVDQMHPLEYNPHSSGPRESVPDIFTRPEPTTFSQPDLLDSNFRQLSFNPVQHTPFNVLSGPPDAIAIANTNLPGMIPCSASPSGHPASVCDSRFKRCTLQQIPATNALLSKSKLPFGLLLCPFKQQDAHTQVPVINPEMIVRCRRCR